MTDRINGFWVALEQDIRIDAEATLAAVRQIKGVIAVSPNIVDHARYQHAPPIQIAHASLVKCSDESDYKAQCPACVYGVLLVYRDQNTLRLRRDDRCISCAQRFVYTDWQIGGEVLP